VIRAVLAAAAFVLAASACASDGRELAEPRDWQTTTTRPPPPTSAPPQLAGDTGLTLSSPDFEPGGDLPAVARCDGDNRFPTLEWTPVDPDLGAVELAVTLSDQTDPEEPLLLWLMAGIEPDITAIPSGTFPNDAAFETLNDYGQQGFGTPCLESFENGRRDLQFKLYVLGSPSGLSSGDPGNTSWDDITAKAVETATVLTRVDSFANP
jgi:phosphatidylethanolamine-binding protein (PEBP) family uncharacterized protein